MTISRANRLDIYYEAAGARDAPVMVFVHALPFDHNLWLYQAQRFSQRFRTIAMDLRGWGRSAKPHAPFTLRDMGDDVMGILRDEGVTSALVMGCSIGSKIALMLACDHAEVFKGTILIGGNSGPQNQFDHRIKGYRDAAAGGTLRDYHLGHLRHGVTQTWADTAIGRYLLDGFVERGAALDVECIAHVFGALTVSDLTPKLPSYKTPTLIVNGEHDSALKGGTRTAGLLRNVEHKILPGAGHCCFLEQPAVFDGYVNDFLARHGLLPAL